MSERIPQDEPSDEDAGKAPQESSSELQVPVPEDFEVKQVTVIPEDLNERDRIREEYGDKLRVRRDLGDTGLGQAPASRGHKSRGNRRYD